MFGRVVFGFGACAVPLSVGGIDDNPRGVVAVEPEFFHLPHVMLLRGEGHERIPALLLFLAHIGDFPHVPEQLRSRRVLRMGKDVDDWPAPLAVPRFEARGLLNGPDDREGVLQEPGFDLGPVKLLQAHRVTDPEAKRHRKRIFGGVGLEEQHLGRGQGEGRACSSVRSCDASAAMQALSFACRSTSFASSARVAATLPCSLPATAQPLAVRAKSSGS